METYQCTFCNRLFKSKQALCSHTGKCKQNPNATNSCLSEKQKQKNLNQKGKNVNKKVEVFCEYCGRKFNYTYVKTAHIKYYCLSSPLVTEESRNKIKEKNSKIQQKTHCTNEYRKAASERTVFNNFWKYRSKNPIIYESPIAGKIKLDSKWELLVAKRLDFLNVEWYRPKIRLPYFDSNGAEHGYFPDFYIKSYNCFIEVKSPFIANWQNSKDKVEYIKSHYNFVKWIESEDECNNFILENLGFTDTPEKDIEDITYWLNLKKEKVKKETNKVNIELEKQRWEIIQNSNIDFSKFGWVKEIAKLFGIAENKAGKYIKKHYPNFYKEKCFIRKVGE